MDCPINYIVIRIIIFGFLNELPVTVMRLDKDSRSANISAFNHILRAWTLLKA